MTMMDRSQYKKVLHTGPFVRLVVITVCLVVAGVVVGPWIRDAVVGLVVPLTNTTAYATFPRSLLIERLHTTESELIRHRYMAVVYQPLAEENARLKKEHTMRPLAAYGTARIVARPPRTHYDTLLIAAGEGDGVRVGDTATVFGIAVGVVTDISRASAIVALYSSPGASMDVALGDPRSIVVLHGVGGGSFESSLPGGIAIALGDTATDSAGMVIATVASIELRQTDTTKVLRLVSPIDFSKSDMVSLVHQP